MNSIWVNRKEFQNYKGVSHVTSSKQYKLYLELASKDEKQELTIYDLSRIDDLPLDIVAQRCNKH